MIDFRWELMSGFFVIFLLLLTILNFTFFQPILRHIEARKNHLAGDQNSAQNDLDEAARLNGLAAETISQARHEAHKIRDEAHKEAIKKAEARIAEEQEKINAEILGFEENLKNDKAELKNALLGQAPLFKERLRIKFITAA
ncbi:MAG: F0F1 ATP synthase subunit B' [Helicobacteraceae bacterium]|jgi:F0F1-type ATP synthase membrane subunit b/b'|nr:F0F1 ATP synthase subunit B' [Helicobacteraceae bacterium]